jgi:hypothetical protein
MGPNGATGAVYLAHRDLPQRPVALTRAPGVSLCFLFLGRAGVDPRWPPDRLERRQILAARAPHAA